MVEPEAGAPDVSPNVSSDVSPWTVIDVLFTVATFLGGSFLAGVTAMVLLMVYSMRGHGPFDASRMIEMMTSDARLLLPVQLVSSAMVVGFVFLTARVKYKQSFASALQWRPPKANVAGMFLGLGVALAILSQLVPVLFPT